MHRIRRSDRLQCARPTPAAVAVAGALSVLPASLFADELPDCAEAFGEDIAIAVHDGEQGNLNLRDDSRVFMSTGVGANTGGGSSLNQRPGTYCIEDDDPTDPSPGACDTLGAVLSWEAAGRDFPKPPTDPGDIPNGPNLTVGDGETVTITTTEGDPQHYRSITIENGGHLIIEGDGEFTIFQRFEGEAGAELTINGAPILNSRGRVEFGGGGTRSLITVNSDAQSMVDMYADGRIDIDNTTVDVTEGTWRPMPATTINIDDSDLNCDPTHAPGGTGWQPADVMPDCNNETGGIFIIARSGAGIGDSAVRAFVYVDGQQYNAENSLLKGSSTGGGTTFRHVDFVPDAIPGTGDFCEEKVREFTFDVGAGDASTCRRREVRITPRDRFGQPLATFSSTIDLETSSSRGDWFRLDEEGEHGEFGAVNDPFDTGNNDGFGRYMFDTDDEGRVSLFLENIHADDLRITVTTDSQVPAGETEISSTSGLIAFRDNVFVIESVDNLGDDVIAGRDHLFEAALWRRDGDAPDGEECAVPITYNASDQATRIWIERHGDDPDGTAPDAVALGTGSNTALNDDDPGSPNIALDFSGDNSSGPGRARFRLETTDVGKYAFALAEQNSGFAVDEAGDPRPITGGSDDYVVRPFAFDVQVSGDNPEAGGPGGDDYLAAGEAFDVTVRAVRYLPTADVNGDGHPDHYAGIGDDDPEGRVDLAAAPTTRSFGAEGIAGSADLDAVLWQPAGGNDPGLGNGPGTVPGSDFADPGIAAAGEAEVADVHYDEVGIVVLNAFLADYLGSGREVRGGTRGPVGRFIPAEFRLERMGADDEINHRAALANCTSEFTYMGEGFDAIFTLRAFSLQDNVTENYEGDFAFLDPSDPAAFGVAGYADGTDPVDDLQAEGADGQWDRGEAREVALRLRVARGCDEDDVDCPKEPYAALHIGIDPEDADGVRFTAFDLPVNDDEDHAEVGVADVRFGRLVLDNAAGSELGSLDLRMAAEYWDGTNWALNDDDACTVIAIDDGDELTLRADGGDTDDGTDTVTLDSGGVTGLEQDTAVMLDGGVALFTLSAPGAGNSGWAEILLDLDGRWPYLRDEDDDGDWEASPIGRVTFGLHQGADGRIYLQEARP